MAMINCPECQRPVSDQARSCPSCGYPFKGVSSGPAGRFGGFAGYEYKSKTTLFGLPLVHIVSGPGPDGRIKPAKGIIAIGSVAIGVFALGGISLGVVCVGGICLGLFGFGGLSVGLAVAVGGFALGYLALGGMAIGIYAIGGLSLGIHTLQNDPNLLNIFKNLFKHTSRYIP
jgi:hypothetical protein